ncbi:MAG TPA: LPS export ABC transporter periplasmic protein LptC [Bacillota bacterium]|nr:LPS export ABC transporter periplasmic protein LptC [Bacillota bacterium]HOL09414.1 LPS export ABC transporter periplasmic protein LptC [Bacillota bacterium]HPO97138.1 LPS export ABC transporter periplasmic protein LptC [Bacillota bacterium]
MNKIIKLTLFLIIISLLYFMGQYGGWWDGMFSPAPEVKIETPQPRSPSIVIETSKLTGWIDQKKTWQIEAERIWQTAEGNIVHFEKIKEGIIFSVEDKQVLFQAGWARWERMRGVLYIGGDVEAKTDDKVFVSKEIIMNHRKEELISEGAIQVTGKNMLIKAGSMKLSLQKDELLLEKGIELNQDNDQVKAKGIIYNLETEEYELIEPEGVILQL